MTDHDDSSPIVTIPEEEPMTYSQESEDSVRGLVAAMQRDAETLLTNSIRSAVAEAERRGYERAKAEAEASQEARAAAVAKLGGEGLLSKLGDILSFIREAKEASGDAQVEADEVQSNLDSIETHVEDVEVDTDYLETVDVPTSDSAFDEVTDFMSEHGGDTLVSARELSRGNVSVTIGSVDFDANEASSRAADAQTAAETAMELLQALIEEMSPEEEPEPEEAPEAPPNGSNGSSNHTMYAGV